MGFDSDYGIQLKRRCRSITSIDVGSLESSVIEAVVEVKSWGWCRALNTSTYWAHISSVSCSVSKRNITFYAVSSDNKVIGNTETNFCACLPEELRELFSSLLITSDFMGGEVVSLTSTIEVFRYKGTVSIVGSVEARSSGIIELQ